MGGVESMEFVPSTLVPSLQVRNGPHGKLEMVIRKQEDET